MNAEQCTDSVHPHIDHSVTDRPCEPLNSVCPHTLTQRVTGRYSVCGQGPSFSPEVTLCIGTLHSSCFTRSCYVCLHAFTPMFRQKFLCPSARSHTAVSQVVSQSGGMHYAAASYIPFHQQLLCLLAHFQIHS